MNAYQLFVETYDRTLSPRAGARGGTLHAGLAYSYVRREAGNRPRHKLLHLGIAAARSVEQGHALRTTA